MEQTLGKTIENICLILELKLDNDLVILDGMYHLLENGELYLPIGVKHILKNVRMVTVNMDFKNDEI
jgi:hypothetical protein